MEIEDTSSPRVSIGFPLGLALLFALFFFICVFFCCCLHWDKIQSLLRSSGIIHEDHDAHLQSPDLTSSHQKPPLPLVMTKQNEIQSLPVLMPGDAVPKFIAMACPCRPLKDESVTIKVEKPASTDFCSSS